MTLVGWTGPPKPVFERACMRPVIREARNEAIRDTSARVMDLDVPHRHDQRGGTRGLTRRALSVRTASL